MARKLESIRLFVLSSLLVLASAAGAQAMQGDEMTTCASYELDDGPDSCYGADDERATVSRSGVVRLRLYCMEDPGEQCTGLYEAPFIRVSGPSTRFLKIRRRGSFAIAAGREGGIVTFKLATKRRVARARAKVIRRRGGYLRIVIGTRQPSEQVETTSIDEVYVSR